MGRSLWGWGPWMKAGSHRLRVCSGPPGFLLQNADRAVATVTSVQPGRYVFRLTVSDQEGATDSASLTVRVQEGEGGALQHKHDLSGGSDPPVVRPSSSLQSSSGGPRQRKPHPHAAQQLPGPQRVRERRRPEPGPLPVDQRPPESCCRGEWSRAEHEASGSEPELRGAEVVVQSRRLPIV